MSIDGPVIIDEHGDTEVYSSVDEAVSDLEAIDVRNGEYEAFDSAGTPLDLLPEGSDHPGILPVSVSRGQGSGASRNHALEATGAAPPLDEGVALDEDAPYFRRMLLVPPSSR